jgi:hypothetical protein
MFNNDELLPYDYWLISIYPKSYPNAYAAIAGIFTSTTKLNQHTD